MSKGDHLGEFEQVVLWAILALQPRNRAYGMTVRQEIKRRTGRDTAIGAVYATLNRLELKGFVSAYDEPGDAPRGYRSRRIFKVTGAGQSALASSHEMMRAMAQGIRLAVELGNG